MKQIQYPEISKDSHIEGTEVVQFVITTKGEVTDFKIINSLSPEIDEEVLRVLKTTNKMWRPGLNEGKPVAMGKEIAIIFKDNFFNENPVYVTHFVDQAKKFFNVGNKQLYVKKNSKKALKFYNRAVCYLPKDKALLVTRGMCRFELGDEKGACQDWNRIKSLGGFESDAYLNNFCEMKGYKEMVSTLQGK
jgi:TonB family protein